MAEELYEKFENHHWEDDEVFKVCIILIDITNLEAGVQKALDLKRIPKESSDAQSLIEKYKYFYFSK